VVEGAGVSDVTAMTDTPNLMMAHCNACGGTRRHEVLHSERSTWEDYDEDDTPMAQGWDQYDMLRCRGCDEVRLRHTSYSSVDGASAVRYYPPSISRRTPRWAAMALFHGIPEVVGDLIGEIYVAVQNDSPRLAAMGIRALLEHVMIEKVGDLGKFGRHVQAFQQAGYLPAKQAESLETILDAGHATIHRSWKPAKGDIQTLLDITESIIETVYIHGRRVEALRKRVPAREPPEKT
jgi:hypothetical protein